MSIDRRRFLAWAGASLSGVLLGACNSYGPHDAKPLLDVSKRGNEALGRALFRHTSMDHPARAMPGVLPRYYISRTVPVWDPRVRGPWALEIGGAVRHPIRLDLDALMRLPSITHRVNHYCVEGWTAVTEWTGVRVSEIARRVGLEPDVAYVDFLSFDSGYHESWDLESALHPQTLIAYGYEGHLLAPAHGAPARVHSPIKLGYKNTKYLTRINFLPHRTGGYWSDRGYEWYAGT